MADNVNEAHLKSALKRVLDKSLANELGNNMNVTSTPKKPAGKKARTDASQLSLDASIVESVHDLVNESVSGAIDSVNSKPDEQMSQKNKKIVGAVLTQLKDVLVKAINSSLELFFAELAEQLNHKIDCITESVQKSALLSRYEADKLEQYTRRKNVRIFMNVPDTDTSEDLVGKVKQIGAKVGVDISNEDLAACHKAGRNQVLCRFVNRPKKDDLMRNKKKLKQGEGAPAQSKVFINEDLTPLRAKLFKLCRGKYKGAHTINGKIVIFRDGQRTYVESPEDLFSIGIDVDDSMLINLGLEKYLVARGISAGTAGK